MVIFLIFRTGSSFPHVVDVDWRLDYYIKVNRRYNTKIVLGDIKFCFSDPKFSIFNPCYF